MFDNAGWKLLTCLVWLSGICSQLVLSSIVLADEKPDLKATSLRKALTFHASFDRGIDADFGKGDRRLYTAVSLNDRKNGTLGLPENGAVSIAKGEGRFGDALCFQRATPDIVFFQTQQNFSYAISNWNGTVSFWLKLDPNKDLPAGYSDPLFITPKVFNDGALWVDFNDQVPRILRHGAVPDRKVWDPNLRDFDKLPEAERPVAAAKQPPFSRENWTHIVFTFANFNTGKLDGVSTLYLNGKLAGVVSPREQTYTWDPSQSTAVLGINYIGLFDELAFFNQALTAAEVKALHELPGGIRDAQ